MRLGRIVAILGAAILAACAPASKNGETVLTFSGSALGAEGTLVQKQLKRFMQLNPGIRVELQRTPDDANQRHQLYVQWLNARVGNPSILQLDVVWTPEFAAAGWVLPLDPYGPPRSEFFPATVIANTWAGKLYALPWFADVGLLYRRTDLVPNEPKTLEEMVAQAQAAMAKRGGPRYGIVSQGARYEGLITGFVEYLGAFGGRIIDDKGEVVVNRPEAVRALEFMRDELYKTHVAPLDVLTWHEEEARFAFQNGNAVFMRNWPYPVAAMSDTSQSKVAGKFTVSPMPASGTAPNGHSTAALGGAQLAINAYTDHPGRSLQADRLSHRAGPDARARAGREPVSDASSSVQRPTYARDNWNPVGERASSNRERDTSAGNSDLHGALRDSADRAPPRPRATG